MLGWQVPVSTGIFPDMKLVRGMGMQQGKAGIEQAGIHPLPQVGTVAFLGRHQNTD